jgi:hypothetical protein
MGDRVYPPQEWIHESTCDGAPRGLPTFPVGDTMRLHPHSRPHICINRNTITFNRDCVAESGDIGPHPYVRSTIWPEDATGPLCHTCHGSHPESRIEAGRRTRVPQ